MTAVYAKTAVYIKVQGNINVTATAGSDKCNTEIWCDLKIIISAWAREDPQLCDFRLAVILNLPQVVANAALQEAGVFMRRFDL